MTDITSVEFVTRVRAILKLNGKSLGEAEKECGVAPGYMSRVIARKGDMSFEVAQKLAETTGYSFIDIFTRDIAKEAEIIKYRKELAELEERVQKIKELLGE